MLFVVTSLQGLLPISSSPRSSTLAPFQLSPKPWVHLATSGCFLKGHLGHQAVWCGSKVVTQWCQWRRWAFRHCEALLFRAPLSLAARPTVVVLQWGMRPWHLEGWLLHWLKGRGRHLQCALTAVGGRTWTGGVWSQIVLLLLPLETWVAAYCGCLAI